jgi:predicted RNase H-like HicB family nuclease
MSNYSFTVRWSDEDEGYIAVCPEFPGVSAWGETPDDAIREVQVALELSIEIRNEEGWELPAPWKVTHYSGQFRLRVPAWLHQQLAERAELEGVSLNTLAVSYLAAGLGSPRPVDGGAAAVPGARRSRKAA